MTQMTLKHPLSVTMAAGLDNLERLRLNTESSMKDDIEAAGAFSQVLTSAHAPVKLGEQRLNYAATDESFRRQSIEQVERFIDQARRHPKVKKVNLHFPPRRWTDDVQTQGQTGDHGLMVDAIREIATFADRHDIEVVLENNNVYWDGVSDDVDAGRVDWDGRNSYFGTSPEEWAQVCEEVDRPNVGLCLDSSHTVTYAHSFSPERREERVMAFVARPELIKHVHWNDNYLYDLRGRVDSHALLGKGTLPVELHRRIKALDATLLLEHFYSTEDLEEELEFIESL